MLTGIKGGKIMKQKKFSEEQIVKIVKEKESGVTGRELARK